MIVVADSGPLHYLVALDEVELLRQFYGNVHIPAAVAHELSSPGAPAQVAKWIADLPAWVSIEIIDDDSVLKPSAIGAGESEAIALALMIGAGLVLMDDRAGRREARRRNLEVTGTLGILRIAAERGLIDVPSVVRRLRSTNFYVGGDLILSFFGRWLRD